MAGGRLTKKNGLKISFVKLPSYDFLSFMNMKKSKKVVGERAEFIKCRVERTKKLGWLSVSKVSSLIYNLKLSSDLSCK